MQLDFLFLPLYEESSFRGASLEGLTRQYNNHIIIQVYPCEMIEDSALVIKRNSVTVKRKEKPVVAYAPYE